METRGFARVRTGLLALVCCTVGLSAGPPSARAVTFTVTKTSDTNDGSCAPTDCSLREAIIASNAVPGTDTVSVPPGHYDLTIPGADEGRCATGDLDFTDSVLLQGAGASSTTVDAHQIDRVFDVLNEATAEISGVTITGGSTSDNGGGIRAYLGIIDLKDAIVTGNKAVGSGGGISVYYRNLSIARTSITNNTAGSGGGISTGGATFALSEVSVTLNTGTCSGGGLLLGGGGNGTIEDSQVSSNSSPGRDPFCKGDGAGITSSGGATSISRTTVSSNIAAGSGGGINNCGQLVLTNTSTWGNRAANGGGIYSSGGPSSLSDSEILWNVASQDGGGIYNTSAWNAMALERIHIFGNIADRSGGGVYNTWNSGGFPFTMSETTIFNNTAAVAGGGLYHGEGSETAILRASTIRLNESRDGAGVYISSGMLRQENMTISGNTATGQGGALHVAGGAVSLTHSTLADNAATSARAVYISSGDLTITNSLLSGECYVYGASQIHSNGGNIESPSATCLLYGPSDKMGVADPNIGSLSNNGGFTWTHALLSGSPAIDRALNGNCLEVDQRGEPRPTDGDGDGTSVCDVGAYEAASLLPATPTISGHVLDNSANAISGVVMAGLPGTPQTDAFGYYSGTVSAGWSGTVAPQKAGYTFAPQIRSYSAVASDQVNQDYTGSAQAQLLTISGHVLDGSGQAMSGVAMSGLAGTPASDADGYYSGAVSPGWSGTVTPQKAGNTFNPPSRAYSGVTANRTNQDYSSVTNSRELVSNSSFELGSGCKANDWKGNKSVMYCAPDGRVTGSAYNGSYSLKLTGNGSTKKITHSALQPGAAGEQLTFSAASMASAVSSGGTCRLDLTVLFIRGDGTTYKKKWKLMPAVGTHGWETNSIYIQTTDRYLWMKPVIVYSKSSGTVWFDDVSVHRGPFASPVDSSPGEDVAMGSSD